MSLSRRALSAKKNGRLGGLSTASKYSEEYLKQRSSRAGSATRDKYGSEYYRYLRSLNPVPTHTTKKNSLSHIANEVKNAVKNLTPSQMLAQIKESVGL